MTVFFDKNVFRLITVGTVKHKIHRLLQDKLELAKSHIDEHEAGSIKQLDREQLRALLPAGTTDRLVTHSGPSFLEHHRAGNKVMSRVRGRVRGRTESTI